MGVQDLWSTIGPIRESVPLYSLTGQTLAVDLSLWVCEAQHVQAMMGRVAKPHLRNLFFRVSSLTLMGIKLVFVMEGEAPKLKAETMSKRTESRFGGVKKAPSKSTKATTTIKSTGRGRFMAVLRECADMLDCLGVPWVTAAGEAEAMCAYLDSQGLVDGCITNDGDAFLYGAKTVYRNFNTTTKDPLVDCYRTSRVQSELHLSREDLVGLAILLGCDYIPKGIHGVGKEHVLKLIQTLKGQTLIQRFHQWQEEGLCVPVGVTKKVPHCKLCLHPGSAKAHERRGCLLCHSQQFCQPQDYDYQCPCDWHRTTQQANSFEAGIRKKTLASEHFPFTEIIEEFLISKDKPVPKFRWAKPNMLPMQKFALQKMEWPKHYTSEKVLVLMTYTDLMNRICRKEASSQIKPLRILKPRVRNGVACLEIVWSTPEHYAFPEEDPVEGQGEVRTVEEEALFSQAYPDVVERYRADRALAEEDKTKKKKVKSKKEKPSDICDGLTDLLAHMNLQSSVASKPVSKQSAPPPPLTAPTAPEHSPETVGVALPAPQSQQPKHPKPREDRCPPYCAESASSFASLPAAAASPSISAIVDLLHLSDIDWDGSFTSSPAPSASTAEPWGTPDAGGRVERSLPTGGVAPRSGPLGPRPAQEVGYMERPLRERLLMWNTAVTGQTKTTEDPFTKRLDNQSQSQHGAAPVKAETNTQLSDKHYAVDRNKTSTFSQSSTNKASRDHHVSELSAAASAQGHSKGIYAGSGAPKPRAHSDSVRAALSSASIIPHQRHFDPVTLGNGDRKPPPQGAKRSVCTAVCSSSEDSGAEKRPAGAERRAKSKSLRHRKLKPASKAPAAACSKSSGLSSSGSTSQAVQRPTASQEECFSDGLPKTSPDQDVFIACVPSSSPVTVLDSDDSLSGDESPLPLAERLRLKYLM